ncbi:MAG: hypothetical protein ACO2ZM_03610 [Francisellaceae bacterium]
MRFYEDFTECAYRGIVETAVGRNPLFYEDIDGNDDFMLWRHDVDISLDRSLALAKIEAELQMPSTYFILVNSAFYNAFEARSINIVKKIMRLGHRIGLHFDPGVYSIHSSSDLESYLKFEKHILETLYETRITVFSFHNPTLEILNYDDYYYCDMINAYARYFKDNVHYCSDSNGYWRYERLVDFLAKNHRKSQVLTHPAWWQKAAASPRARIQRCIDGRAVSVAKEYDTLLRIHGRENVGA